MFSSDAMNDLRFGIEILTVIFVVYLYFRKPQIEADTEIKAHFAKLTGFMDRVELLFSQVNKDVVNLKENHIHTLEVKTDQLQGQVQDIEKGQVRLLTILEERLPRK